MKFFINIKRILLLFITLCCHYFSAYSQTFAGSDLSYINIADDTYEFTLSLYRSCKTGRSLPTEQKISYSAVSCFDVKGNVILTQRTVENLVSCSAQLSACDGGSLDGFQKVTYKGQFKLPAKCDEWLFQWQGFYRATEITNIEKPSQTPIYLEAKINNRLSSSNSSPSFDVQPIVFTCINTPYNFPIAKSTDGDRFTVELVSPKLSIGTSIKYVAGYNASNAIGTKDGLKLDANGLLSFTPTIANQKGVLSFVVKEFKNNLFIGSTTRDILIATYECQNTLPTISIPSQISDTFKICSGVTWRMLYEVKDNDQNQLITVSFLNTPFVAPAVPPRSLLIRNTIRWTPTDNQVGIHEFTIQAQDNACPVEAKISKKVIVRVYPSVQVKVPSDTIVGCLGAVKIQAKVFGGTAPFSYQWDNKTTDNQSSVFRSIGTTIVKVTDAISCTSSDTSNLKKSISSNLELGKLCAGDSVSFIDKSISLGGVITQRFWFMGDGKEETLSPGSNIYKHLYKQKNDTLMKAQIIVRDSKSCTDTATVNVNFCQKPSFGILYRDSCQYDILHPYLLVEAIIKKASACAADITYTWSSPTQKNVNLLVKEQSLFEAPKDTGDIKINLKISYNQGCSDSVSQKIHITPKPILTLIDKSYFLHCRRLNDTIIRATAEICPRAKKLPVYWQWSNIISQTFFNSTDSFLVLNIAGSKESRFIRVQITDGLRCVSSNDMNILYPLGASLVTTPYCHRGDSVLFKDNYSSPWGIYSKMFTFGDGDSLKTFKKGIKHFYLDSVDQTYSAQMEIIDSSNCSQIISNSVLHYVPLKQITVSPSLFQCYGSLTSISGAQGLTVGHYRWLMGDGTIYDTRSNLVGAPSHIYMPGRYQPKQIYEYNGGACIDSILLNPSTIEIYPRVSVAVKINNNCAGKPTNIRIHKNSGNFPIASFNWTLSKDPLDSILYTSNSSDTTIILNEHGSTSDQFQENGTPINLKTGYRIKVIATDTEGCKTFYLKNDDQILDTTFDNELVRVPRILKEKPEFCLNQIAKMGTDGLGRYNNIDADQNQWIFNDSTITLGKFGNRRFNKAGTYEVYMIVKNRYGCTDTAKTTTPIPILPTPKAAFHFYPPKICIGKTILFNTDSSKPVSGSSLTKFYWDYRDGSNVFDTITPPQHTVVHQFNNAGIFKPMLIAEDANTCTDTVKYPPQIPIQVDGNPIADFTVSSSDANDQQNFYPTIPLTFTNRSSSDGNSTYYWTFGSGDSSHHPSPDYAYKNAGVYTVRLITTNSTGCPDTVEHKVDLNSYAIVPQAFSPNNDGSNDRFNMIFRGIKELKIFRIYNRWGQLVYDVSASLHKPLDVPEVLFDNNTRSFTWQGWDGKFNGEDQPIGRYVYQIEAVSGLTKSIILHGNLTLIR